MTYAIEVLKEKLRDEYIKADQFAAMEYPKFAHDIRIMTINREDLPQCILQANPKLMTDRLTQLQEEESTILKQIEEAERTIRLQQAETKYSKKRLVLVREQIEYLSEQAPKTEAE